MTLDLLDKLPVAIVGGGIGGLATALAFHQRGISCRVFESAPRLDPVGAGIWLPSNAMQVLDRLGLAEAVESAGVRLRRAELKTAAGRPLIQVDFDAIRHQFGWSTVSIDRFRLQAILAEALPEGILQLGKRFAGLRLRGDAFELEFADGDHILASAVVGADGLRSRVRQELFPQARLRFAGQTCYRGVANLAIDAIGRENWGRRRRFGFSPLADDRTYWFAPVTSAADIPLEDAAVVRHRFRDFGKLEQSILAATPGDQMLKSDLFDLRPLKRWNRGRIILLGDAAHASTPNLGQGGAQALEDAATLAHCLGEQRTDPASAFARYVRLRRPKAVSIVRRSRIIGRFAHLPGGLPQTLRDALIAATPRAFAQAQFRALARLSF